MLYKMLSKLLHAKKTGVIFAGHGVALDLNFPKIESIHISFQNLVEIVETLKRMDFDFLSMEEIIDISKVNFYHHKHWTHITFDDGYQNNFDVIYPYLKAKGIPFSIFVSTSYIESRDRFPTFWIRLAQDNGINISKIYRDSGYFSTDIAEKDFEYSLIKLDITSHNALVEKIKNSLTEIIMNDIDLIYYNDMPLKFDSLLKLASEPKIHLGAHSHFHVACHEKQDISKGVENIKISLQMLKEIWNVSSNPTYCYPNGNHDLNWMKKCREMHIPLAFASTSGFIELGSNPLSMPRFWLSNKKKIFVICIISLFGTKFLNMIKFVMKK